MQRRQLDPEGAADAGDSVSVAMTTPTWILPISQPGKTQGENAIFRQALYPSLFSYELDGGDDEYNLDRDRSMVEDVQVSDDGLTYTMTLKDLTWSDGTSITSRDVEFWYNLVVANKEDWASYREGGFPRQRRELRRRRREHLLHHHHRRLLARVVHRQPAQLPDPPDASARLGQDLGRRGEIGDLDRDPETAQESSTT